MKISQRQIVAWIVVVICALVNGMLLLEAIQLQWLTGAGAAQGDFGLFMVVMGAGVPVAIVSAVLLIGTYAVKNRADGFYGVMQYNYGAGFVSLVNLLLPLGIMYWLLYVW